MSAKKLWSQQQDNLLEKLCSQSELKKWPKIARKMFQIYNMPLRTGKQCKERYQNHLNLNTAKEDWSYEEQLRLYKLHEEIGNKWAVVASHMKGRTDNCVKNHFYSQLRKGLRKINKYINDNMRKNIRQFRVNVVYKVLEAIEDKFKKNSSVSEEVSELASNLKVKFIQYSYLQDDTPLKNIEHFSQLVQSMHKFVNIYKRKPKKCRRGQSKEQFYKKNQQQNKGQFCLSFIPKITFQQNEQSSIYQEESIQIEDHKPQMQKRVCEKQKFEDMTPTFQFADERSRYLSLNVEDILGSAGVLENEQNFLHIPEFLKKSSDGIYEHCEKKESESLFNLGQSIQLHFIQPLKDSIKRESQILFQSQ